MEFKHTYLEMFEFGLKAGIATAVVFLGIGIPIFTLAVTVGGLFDLACRIGKWAQNKRKG